MRRYENVIFMGVALLIFGMIDILSDGPFCYKGGAPSPSWIGYVWVGLGAVLIIVPVVVHKMRADKESD